MDYEEARGAVEKAIDDLTGADEPDSETGRKAVRAIALVGVDAVIDVAESLNRIANSMSE